MNKLIKLTSAIIAVSAFTITSASAASKNSARVLQYVPADTPYVLASTEPLPDKLADRFDPTVDELLKAYQKVVRHVMAEQLVKMAAEGESEEDAAAVRGVADELIDLMSLEGLRGAGIERDSAFVFYGNGLLPVIRIELSDEELFDKAIARIEEQAGESLQVAEAGGETYKFADIEKINLVVATIDEQAVFTIVPSAYGEKQIASALGIDKPRSNLRKSKALKTLGKTYDFSDTFIGFVDNQRIARIFTGQGTASDKELFSILGHTPPELTATCSAEIMEMVGVAPRIVMGYSELSLESIESHVIVELRDDIANGLAAIPAVVPGLGVDPGGLMSIGFGLNPLELRGFYESRIEALEKDPYKCEKFAELQAGVAKGREALNQPLPPVVYSFRGFVANVADINGMDLASNTPPESIDASILVAIENAESLIAMAAMFDPQVAALNLVPDGKPVKLEMAQLTEFAEEAFAALTNDSLSIALGAGAEAKSAEMLVADSVSPAPFMSMSMDSERYYAMIGDAMKNAPADEETGEETPEAIKQAMSDIMLLSGSLYERIAFDVQFTGRGIEIDGRMTLSDD